MQQPVQIFAGRPPLQQAIEVILLLRPTLEVGWDQRQSRLSFK
jgi:hypothetical protein